MSVDAARLERVESIFHEALEAGPSRREALLRERCGDDEALRREVEVLLAAHGRSGGFIETPVASFDAAFFAEEEPDRMAGRVLGHYEITRRIGSGGMGAVYLARRADRQYEKEVAIKLIKRGMDTEEMLRRFRNERQILAGFDHPNIARLLDGDTTEDGLPYFVMEYVEGRPIDEYCEEHAFDVGQRLRLFRQVCAAVSYAHRRAVIHRDLKTSNILVGADGTPKLLDFGIARLLQPGDAEQAPATRLEQRALTPDYASPEHLRGEPVTTASDVYSLGVVLYRLLTGQLPYRLQARSPEELARTLGQTSPQRPSAVAEPDTGRRLRGDLDNIVLMALRKEPERRYPSVEQFSEDLRRHLDKLPVLARRDTFAYRAGKFVRRNTAASVAAALVVLILVGGILMTSWQAGRAREHEAIALAEKARAEHRFNEVRALARSVLFDYHDAIADLSGATAIRERLVKDGLAYLDSLASEAGGDVELQRELAAAYDRLGDVRGGTYSAASLDDRAGAMDSYTKALRIRESLAAAAPADARSRRELASSYRKIGGLLLDTQDAVHGIEYLRKGLAVLGPLVDERPEDLEVRQELGAANNMIGLAMEDAGDPAGALEYHRQALAQREALVAADPGNDGFRRGLIITGINLGRAQVLSGDIQGGLASNRKALESCEALFAGSPSSADYRRLLAVSFQNDGDYRAILGDVRDALASFRRKLPLDEQALAEDPDNAVARGDFAYTQERIGDLLARSGRFREALSHYRKAQAEHRKLALESSDNLYGRFRVMLVHGGVGEMLARLGERDAALAETSRTLALLDGVAPEPGSGTRSSLRGQVYLRVASTHAALGDSPQLGAAERRTHWARAREFYAQSLEVWRDMQRRGILTAEDAAKPRELASAIARCDEALSRLPG